MNQEQLKEQATNYIYYNLHKETQQELILEMVEEMELIEQLKITSNIIENLLLSISYNLETNQDKKNYNKLTTIQLELNDIIKENKGEKENV